MKLSKLPIVSIFLVCTVLNANAQNGIKNITVTDSKLKISSDAPQKPIKIIQLSPVQEYNKDSESVVWQGIGESMISIDRFDGKADRMYSRFLMVDPIRNEPLGTPRYVTDFSLSNSPTHKLPRPESIKGLSCVMDFDDAVDLGVKYIHVNLLINEIIDWKNPDSETFYEFADTRIPLNMSEIHELDEQLKRYTDARISVFLIFLNRMPRSPDPENPLIHPRSDLENSPTNLGGFNITNDKGLKYYLGALEFLIRRYTCKRRSKIVPPGGRLKIVPL